jgi:hypothetical protein
MESKKINQLATELTPSLSDLTIIGDPSTGISKKITLSQMASLFTGTVEEYANLAAFPLVGVADTIYIALDTNVLYRWNTGTNAYVELSPNIINSLVFSDANGFDGTISLVGSVATLTITTALTTGSVGFIGASGALLQDNANFFWDDTNNRLGLGTNAPTTALDVFGSGIIGRLNGTSTNNAFLGFASAGSNKWSIGNVQSDHRFRIYNEATTNELISVLQTGEFGIGIANPTTKFHIDGGASALIANLDANVSVAKSVSFRSDNSNRINLEVSGTESGSNAGANFFIRRYSDAGALIDTPLTIIRSTGEISLANALSGTNATFSSSLNLINASTSVNLILDRGSAILSNGITWKTSGTSDWFLGSSPTGTSTSDLSLYSHGTASVVLNIARSTGAITLANALIVNGVYANTSDVSIIVSNTIPAINLRTPSSGRFTIASSYSNTNRTSLIVGTGTNNPSIEALQIEHSNGAAVFANSLRAVNIGLGFAPQTGIAAFIYDNSAGYNMVIQQDGSGIPFQITSGGIIRTIVTNNGNLGINISTPQDKLDVRGYMRLSGGVSEAPQFNIFTNNQSNNNVTLAQGFATTTDNIGYLYNRANADFIFGTNNTARFTITSGGYLNSAMTYGNTTANAANMVISTGGTFERSTSSIRYKTNVEDLTINTTNILSKMRPIWYRSLGENDRKDWSWYGFIAEELAEIEPRLVHWGYDSNSYETIEIENEEGDIKQEIKLKENAVLIPDGVQYERITVFLVAELQKMRLELDALKAK